VLSKNERGLGAKRADVSNLQKKERNMSKIGTLKQYGPGDFWSDLRGTIRTLGLKADIRIAAVSNPSPNPDAPTHSVFVRDPDGDMMELGSAWKKSITRGMNAGEDFLSVTIDDPSFPHPLNFAIFRNGEEANATWRRRQEQST